MAGAVRKITGARFLRGRPCQLIDELVQDHGEQLVLEALASCELDYGGNPMGLLDWCADMLASSGFERPAPRAEVLNPAQGWSPVTELGCEHCDRGFVHQPDGSEARCRHCGPATPT